MLVMSMTNDHGVVVNDPHDDDNGNCDQNNIQEKCDDDFSVGFNFCGHKANCPDLVKPIACITQYTFLDSNVNLLYILICNVHYDCYISQ